MRVLADSVHQRDLFPDVISKLLKANAYHKLDQGCACPKFKSPSNVKMDRNQPKH